MKGITVNNMDTNLQKEKENLFSLRNLLAAFFLALFGAITWWGVIALLEGIGKVVLP